MWITLSFSLCRIVLGTHLCGINIALLTVPGRGAGHLDPGLEVHPRGLVRDEVDRRVLDTKQGAWAWLRGQ